MQSFNLTYKRPLLLCNLKYCAIMLSIYGLLNGQQRDEWLCIKVMFICECLSYYFYFKNGHFEFLIIH